MDEVVDETEEEMKPVFGVAVVATSSVAETKSHATRHHRNHASKTCERTKSAKERMKRTAVLDIRRHK